MKQYLLGIDTSCYTTSCAIVDEQGQIHGEARKILDVKSGERGLQQSNMVFQHTRALPKLIQELPQLPISGIGVSAFPRREKDSYMPAFLVGRGQAQTLSHIMNVPLYEFSHQENHILAAIRSLGMVPKEPFLSLHLSGGTTELLHCTYDESGFFDVKLIGGAMDLQGGQFVDRVGVALDLPFPAGSHLEQLALESDAYDALPTSVKNGYISFGGPCSEALRRIEKGVDPKNMALALFKCIGRSLEKLFDYHIKQYPVSTVIAVGGVMSNSLLRSRLEQHLRRKGITLLLAEPQFSVDNATGVAYGASLLHNK
ncbi:metallohydrolase [Veillonella sp.]|uniref:Kae1-like domain-containing protein n=1 Tax=Veillonella sp. TaxID=1926307 RepID=UPI001B634BCB|nr:metallohydrolase [Veillonella sp.]MBP9551069.1 metallohydrolase [Veillonella sp.]